MLLQSVFKEIVHAQILVWPLDNIYSLASSLCKDTLKDIIFSCFSQIYFNPCRPQQMPFTQDLNEEIICFTLQKKTVLQSQIYIISTYSSQDWNPVKQVDVLSLVQISVIPSTWRSTVVGSAYRQSITQYMTGE